MRAVLGTLSAVFLVLPVSAFAADYEIDTSHSRVGFAVKHLMVSTVRGEFAKVSGTVSYDAKKPEASVVDVVIDVASINTRDERRDGHLKSPDFFDVARFPTATFKSKKVERAGDGLKVLGDLTLHGVTRPVTLAVSGPSAEVKSPFGTTVIGASATATINRKDYGMVWNKTLDNGGALVGDEVGIAIEVELIKKDAAQAAK